MKKVKGVSGEIYGKYQQQTKRSGNIKEINAQKAVLDQTAGGRGNTGDTVCDRDDQPVENNIGGVNQEGG